MTQPRTSDVSNMAVTSDKGYGIDVVEQHMPTPSAGWNLCSSAEMLTWGEDGKALLPQPSRRVSILGRACGRISQCQRRPCVGHTPKESAAAAAQGNMCL